MRSSSGVSGLRSALLAENYSESGLTSALGEAGRLSSFSSQLTLQQRLQITGSDDIPVVWRFFYCGLPVGFDDLAAALRPSGSTDDLIEAGLVSRDGDRAVPLVRITPFAELLIVHDAEDGSDFKHEHVVGVGPAARSLAALTVRPEVETPLDLGTGSGVQALLLAGHARRVTATDISGRALDVARLNAELNGIESIEFHNGDLYAPVADRTFDLIVANPPFVVSPEREYVFRDSGRVGDAISEEVLRGTPHALNEGGFAHVLCSWVCESQDDWSRPMEQWLAQSGCDAWVLCNKVDSALSYAAEWNRPLLRKSADAFCEAVSRWAQFYRQRGIGFICTGAVILRKRSRGRNWVRTDLMPHRPTGPAGDHILRVFEAQDHLQSSGSDDDLLDGVFSLVDGHLLDQRMSYRAHRYESPEARLYLENGVGLGVDVDPLVTHVLFRLDGTVPLRRIIDEAATDTGIERQQLTEVTLGSIRRLFGLGMLDSTTAAEYREVPSWTGPRP